MTDVQITDIRDWQQVPGSDTYFTTSQVSPQFMNGSIRIFNASGPHRSWGNSRVQSTVTPLTSNVIQVDVTGWHKHSISPEGGRYWFVRQTDGTWERKRKNAKAVQVALAIATLGIEA